MPIVAGQTLANPEANEVLVEALFPSSQHVRVIIIISATYNFDAMLEVWDGQSRVVFDLPLPVEGPAWMSPELGPIIVPQNGRIRIVAHVTPTSPSPQEVQAAIFWRQWAER